MDITFATSMAWSTDSMPWRLLTSMAWTDVKTLISVSGRGDAFARIMRVTLEHKLIAILTRTTTYSLLILQKRGSVNC